MTTKDDVYQELYGLIDRAATPLKAIEIATDLVPATLSISPINKNALYLLALKKVLETQYAEDPLDAYAAETLEQALDTIQKSTNKLHVCEACCYLVARVEQGHGNSGLDYTPHYLTALHRLRVLYRQEQE